MLQLTPSANSIASFLAPPWMRSGAGANRRTETIEVGRGRQIAKGVIFSSRPISDSLFARHLTASLKATLILTAVHVDGGLNAASAAAALARAQGIASLPSIALWPDAESHQFSPRSPLIFSIAEKTDLTSREILIDSLRNAATPSVPALTAANYHELCGPAATSSGFDDSDGTAEMARFCALLFVPLPSDGTWPAEAISALAELRAAASRGSSTHVRFGWVDAVRQEPFAHHVLAGAGACHR